MIRAIGNKQVIKNILVDRGVKRENIEQPFVDRLAKELTQ